MATPLLRMFRATAPGVALFAQTAATRRLLAAANTRPWGLSSEGARGLGRRVWASRSFQAAAFAQGEKGDPLKNGEGAKMKRGKGAKSPEGEMVHKLNMACRDNDLTTGLAVLDEMKAAGLDLPEVAHERMLYLYSKNGRVTETESTFEVLESLRSNVPENRYIMLMQAYAAGGMVEQALRVMGQMKDKSIDLKLRAYNSIMPALVSGPGGIDAALQLLGDMDKQPACTRAQDPLERAKGFAVLWEMRHRGVMVAPKDMQPVGDWFTHTKPMGADWKVEESRISKRQQLEELLLPSDRLSRLANQIKDLVHSRGAAHRKELRMFEGYLADHGPFDIVDLANQLQEQGHRPLVLLRMHIARKPTDDMHAWGWDRLKSLEAAGRLYYVADRTPDDLYFLHGALNSNLRSAVITNDLMRDHKLTMEKHILEDFLKWQRSCQVRFDYDFVRRRTVLRSPQAHDYVVQHSEDGSTWHIPPTPRKVDSQLIISGREDRWLCVRATPTA